MNIQKRKIVVSEILLPPEIVQNLVASGIGVVAEELERIAYGLFIDIGYVFFQELPHSIAVQPSQTVNQVEVGIEGNPAPVELQIVGVVLFIHDFAQEQVNQFVEGVFTP